MIYSIQREIQHADLKGELAAWWKYGDDMQPEQPASHHLQDQTDPDTCFDEKKNCMEVPAAV